MPPITVGASSDNRRPREGGHVVYAMSRPTFGGAERFLAAVMGSLRDDGARITLAIVGEARGAPDATASWFIPVADAIVDCRANPEAIAELKPDVYVPVTHPAAYDVLPLLTSRNRGARIVAHQFNAKDGLDRHCRYADLLDLVIVEGAFVADALIACGFPEERIAIIASGIALPSSILERGAAIGGIKAGTPRIGFVGRMDRSKAPLAFVDAVNRYRGPPAEFVMAGEGPDAAKVRSRMASLEVRIDWLGLLPDDALFALLASLDVLVVCSREDGRPLVVQEALTLGVPVIAFAVGGLPELIEHGSNGLLVRPGDIDGLVAAIQRLAADADQRYRLSVGARAGADRFLVERRLPFLRSAILGTWP